MNKRDKDSGDVLYIILTEKKLSPCTIQIASLSRRLLPALFLYTYIGLYTACIVCCGAKYLDWVCYDVTHGVLLATLAAIKRSGAAEFRQPVYKRRIYIFNLKRTKLK